MRSVTIAPDTGEVLTLGDCMPLTQVRSYLGLSTGDPGTITFDLREMENVPSVERFGVYLGSSDSIFVPEVVEDQEGSFTLVFRKR